MKGRRAHDSHRYSRRRRFLELLERRYALSALAVIDPPDNNINSSTFGSGSFQITNTSTSGQLIDRAQIQLETALFRDIVFDPFGLAGDPVGKQLTIDSEGGTGFTSFEYLGSHDGGFDGVQLFFNDFDSGETITFSVDNDPTSIQGLPQPGPNDSGSISGLELVGATITIDFDDSSNLTADYYRIPTSLDGSQALLDVSLPPQPTLEILGQPATPTTVSLPSQTARVTGTPGLTASLLVVEGALFDEGGGFDIDPYEANTAIAVNEFFAVIGPSGFVDIPFTVSSSDANGGTNHIVAALANPGGQIGRLSEKQILQFGGTERVQFAQAGAYAATEAAGTTNLISIVRTGDTSGTSSVQVAATGGSAIQSIDYASGFPLTIPFAPGETAKVVPVTILQDSLAEPTETVVLSLLPVSGAAIGENSMATLQIADDDEGAVPAVRINAGGPSFTDTLGQLWQADTHFSGGSPFSVLHPIAGTVDDVLYQSERFGDFRYDVPLANGNYNVNLKFAELYWNGPGLRRFDVQAEGQPAINDLDVFAVAGHDVAYDQQLTGISVTDGVLNLDFVTIANNAKIAAIEIVPSFDQVQFSQATPYSVPEEAGTNNSVLLTRSGDTSGTSQVFVDASPGTATAGADYDAAPFPLSVVFNPGETSKPVPVTILNDNDQEPTEQFSLTLTPGVGTQLGPLNVATVQILDNDAPTGSAIRVNAGGGGYVALDGRTFVADQHFDGGNTSTTTASIHQTEDDPLYQTARSGASIEYEIPVHDGNYTVSLHFAENTHDDFGERLFNVLLEDQLEIDDLDIYARARNAFFPGKHSAHIVTLPQINVSDGELDIELEATVDEATISAIEVVPLVGPAVLLTQTNGDTVVSEGGAGDTYSIMLNEQPTHDVVVTVAAGPELTTNTSVLTFTPANFAVPQPIVINAVDDTLSEGTRTVVVGHSVSSSDASYHGLPVTPTLSVTVFDNDVPPVSFQKQTVASTTSPTTATWGPDGRLYVGHVTGEIKAYTFDGNYNVTNTQTITTLQGVSNPNILGIGFSPYDDSSSPTLFVAHSLLFANGGAAFPVTELSPYSGQVSLLSGPSFATHEPLITGLPVSNHDHGINGLAFDNHGDLYIAVGGNTNAGIIHTSIGGLPESPFSAAILKATITDLDFNGTVEYELPPEFVPPPGLTFPPEISQVFGGEATVVAGVDISAYGPGMRNPYDVVWTTTGNLFATDNGPNAGFGDASTGPNSQVPAPGTPDEVIHVVPGGYYGHPNRNRGVTDPRQNVFHSAFAGDVPGVFNAAEALVASSTNGIDEYRATTFGGQLRGSLFAQEWNGVLYNLPLNASGESVIDTITYTDVANGLDVVMGPGGAILGIDFSANAITVATPNTIELLPIAYDIFPWRAPATGGNSFTIGGENFGSLADTAVTIGGLEATITSVSPTRISGVLPAFADTNTLHDVSVSSGGTTSVIADAFMPLGAAAPQVSFTQASYQASEAAGNSMVVTVSRSGDVTGTVSVDVTVTGISATPGVDFDQTAFPQTVEFTPGQTSQAVVVPLINDTDPEGNEELQLQLHPSSTATLGTQDTTVLTILDNDDGSSAVRINAAGPGYVDTLGQAWQSDTSFIGGETFATTAAIAGTVDDTLYHTERHGTFQYSIPLADGTYDLKLKFAEIWWNAAGNRLFDVTVEGQQVIDNLDLFAQVGKNVAYDQVFSNIAVTDGALNIQFTTELDSAKVSAIEVIASGTTTLVDFAQATYQVNEGGGTATITVNRSGDTTGTDQVQVVIDGGSATPGSDFDDDAFPVVVTFGPGVSSQDFQVSIIDDTADETTEAIDFQLIPVGDVVVGSTGTTTLQILDNDEPTGEPADSVRINAGGPAYTDFAGNDWQADTQFNGGLTFATSAGIADTQDDLLYQSERYGDFSYNIPLPNGLYNLLFKFAEVYWNVPGARVFDVFVENQLQIDNLDVFAEADAKNTALDQLLSGIAITDGELNIEFVSLSNNAKLSAFQVLPIDQPPTSGAIRINAGGTADFTDSTGDVWVADSLFSNGQPFFRTNPIAGTSDDFLYMTERFGNFSYSIPVADGQYDVVLKFAEIFWQAPGQRVFHVAIEGQQLLSDFDIFSQVGANAVLDQNFPNITVSDGLLNIQFTTVQDNAKVSAIEILSVGGGGAGANDLATQTALPTTPSTPENAATDEWFASLSPTSLVDHSAQASSAFDITETANTTFQWALGEERSEHQTSQDVIGEEDETSAPQQVAITRNGREDEMLRLQLTVQRPSEELDTLESIFATELTFEPGAQWKPEA